MKKWRNENLLKAYKNAFNGFYFVIKNEINLKIQLTISICVILLSIFLKLNTIEFLFIVISIFFVLFAEFVNTAIEVVVDLYTEEYNEKAKIAKDVASASVVVSVICAGLVGIIIFLPKLINLFLK